MFGKLLPYIVIGVVDVAVTLLAGLVIFGVPFRGSVLLLGIMTLLFLAGALGLGIFISAILKSQVLATQVAMVAKPVTLVRLKPLEERHAGDARR